MQKWEYRIEYLRGPNILDELNALGADGWELAGVVQTSKTKLAYYFKRAVPTHP